MSCGHSLQAIITDGRRSAQCRCHVSFFEQPALLCGMRPDPGKAIGLEFKFHRERVRLARIAFLKLMDLTFDSNQFLHVVPELVRQNVRLRKLTGRSEPPVQLIKKLRSM